jgi:hypothetical protein
VLEPRDLVAQRPELGLATGRRRAEEDDPHDEDGGEAPPGGRAVPA